jgi:hypothetical protein
MIDSQDDSNSQFENDVAALQYNVPSKDVRYLICEPQAASNTVAVEAFHLPLLGLHAHPTSLPAERVPGFPTFTELPPDFGSLAFTFETSTPQAQIEASNPDTLRSQLMAEMSVDLFRKGCVKAVRYDFHILNLH